MRYAELHRLDKSGLIGAAAVLILQSGRKKSFLLAGTRWS